MRENRSVFESLSHIKLRNRWDPYFEKEKVKFVHQGGNISQSAAVRSNMLGKRVVRKSRSQRENASNLARENASNLMNNNGVDIPSPC